MIISYRFADKTQVKIPLAEGDDIRNIYNILHTNTVHHEFTIEQTNYWLNNLYTIKIQLLESYTAVQLQLLNRLFIDNNKINILTLDTELSNKALLELASILKNSHIKMLTVKNLFPSLNCFKTLIKKLPQGLTKLSLKNSLPMIGADNELTNLIENQKEYCPNLVELNISLSKPSEIIHPPHAQHVKLTKFDINILKQLCHHNTVKLVSNIQEQTKQSINPSSRIKLML